MRALPLPSTLGLFLLAAATLAACSANDASPPADTPACSTCSGAGGFVGGGNGGTAAGGTSNGGSASGGVLGSSGTTGSTGGSAPGAGGDGAGAGGSVGSGGDATGTGGSVGDGGAPGAGGSGNGGTTGTGGTSPAQYTLVVDVPVDGATLSGTATVSGFAPGFVNVEAWDATHTSPPLGQATPAANGAFTLTVDTTTLASGPTTWTIWAWDSAPGQPATQSDSVALSVTIQNGAGSGGTTGAGGTTGSGGSVGTGGTVTGQTVGTGDINNPAVGPDPSQAGAIGGAKWVLVKNWDFGSSGTVHDIPSLSSEFNYHDQFGTIGNGSNYGAITVAPNAQTAISGQPVEDSSRPYREFTADTMKAYVRPLSASQTSVSVSSHNAGNGSITSKWTLASGGKILGKDLLWETRARMPVAAAAYWFAIWTAGNKWNGGAEMDVLESFGTPNIYPPPAAFHVNSVGGQDQINYSSWPSGLNSAGVPSGGRDLREWHTWSWLYRTDDSYVVYFDGYVVQKGTLHWTLGGGTGGEHIDMSFLFDFGWGHTQISDVNITLPASGFNITYEVDYSRVYLR